jgi:hypothetical protein
LVIHFSVDSEEPLNFSHKWSLNIFQYEDSKETTVLAFQGPTRVWYSFLLSRLTSLGKRKDVADKIISKYPERLPVIVERAPLSGVPEINKKKYEHLFCAKTHPLGIWFQQTSLSANSLTKFENIYV